MLDFSDEVIKTNTDEYLVPHLYATAVTADETVCKLPSESLKKLFTKLQREDAFTQSKI